MIADEIKWLEDRFDALHRRLDVAHDKLNTALVAVSHLIRRDAHMPDHAQILADLKAFDAELDSKVDAAVSEFDSFVATHTAVKDSLDDIAEIVAGLPAKAAKLDAIKEPTDASSNTTSKSTAGTGANTSAPVVSTSVGSDSTTVQTADGATTTVQHADGSASTVDASGSAVETNDAAAQAAKDAASAQGVSIPSA